ncbi:MAG: FtsX-like permease family protein [Solobacterium sp.]|nr:FtsX-like permease family protein [Solobacterium sp.]
MVRRAADKDILRTVREQFKRFLSIVMITLLGVMMFSGLKAACEDLRISADVFFDAQNLHDIYIQSTLGITEDDIKVLQDMEDTERAEGIFAKDVTCRLNGEQTDFLIETLPQKIDIPYVTKGRLPENRNEAAVTEKFIHDTGAKITDVITFSDEDFAAVSLQITGIVTDVRDINNPYGAVSYRTAFNGNNTVYVVRDAVSADIYTAAAVTVKGAEELHTFSDEYRTHVREYKAELEKVIKPEREQARTDEVKDEAQQKIDDAEAEAEEELADAEKELNDAEKEWEDGRQELEDAEKEWKDGKQELDDAEKELNDKKEEADREIRDAQETIDENRQKLKDAQDEIDKGRRELENGRKELQDGQKKLDQKKKETEKEFADARIRLNEALKQAAEGISQAEGAKLQFHEALQQLQMGLPASFDVYESAYEEAYYKALTQYGEEKAIPAETAAKMGAKEALALQQDITGIQTGIAGMCAQLEQAYEGYTAYGMQEEADAALAQKTQLETMSASLDMVPAAAAGLGKGKGTKRWIDDQVTLLAEKEKEALLAFKEAQDEIDANAEKLEKAGQELQDAEQEVKDGQQELADGQQELDDKKKEAEDKIAEAEQEIADAKAELDDAEQEIADAREELDDARQEIDDGWEEYYDGKAEAEEKIQDARDELADIKDAVWYVQDRTSLGGFANAQSDAGAIESIGTVFPVIFFIVAILISLTAVTRMVEEERGLIGTYKSIGYRNTQIMRKYILFSLSAAVIGSVLGTLMAFIALPMFICTFFRIMYLIPDYDVYFIPAYGVLGPALFLLGILAAVIMACRNELKQVPAALMRPKAPRAGSKTLLEKIPFIWTKLSFLNKVTARNIFRYKKRMFMTIFGIAGCMSLLLFGYAIRDSVRDLMPRQYEMTTVYDVMAAADADEMDEVRTLLENDAEAEDMTEIMVTNVRLEHGGREEGIQMIVIRDPQHFPGFVHLYDLGDEELHAEDGKVYITQNAANVLHFKAGEIVRVQQPDLSKADIRADVLVRNYLGNYIYMTEKTYHEYFEDLSWNGFLIRTADGTDPIAFAQKLKKDKNIISTMCTKQIQDQFSDAFRMINVVVYIIIAMSAALAFVVLFTLSATNISEREREIATIKVLGLYDREVHSYIDRETMILTVIGIALGVPLGWLFSQALTSILNIPSMYLAVSLHTFSYVLGAGLTVLFALLVNIVMDLTLDHIEPAVALKSIE